MKPAGKNWSPASNAPPPNQTLHLTRPGRLPLVAHRESPSAAGVPAGQVNLVVRPER